MSFDTDFLRDRAKTELLAAAKDLVRDGNSSAWTPERRALLDATLEDLAGLVAYAAAGKDVERELAHIVAVLADFGAITALVLARASGRVLDQVGVILGRLARAVLAGAIAASA